MSHELRTPMNAIIGFAQMLEYDDTLNADQHDNVGEILKGGRHLLELINEVLDLAKIESGSVNLSMEPVDLVALVEDCGKLIQPLAEKRQITFCAGVTSGTFVHADRTRIKQVLLNLLSNAVKYNRQGGAVHVSCAQAAGQRLRISIRDTGRGIGAAALPRLFQPFERMESAYDGIEGTGIGLALSKELVTAMHGEIGVHSVPGEGSTFWFELPLSEAASSTEPVASASGPRRLLYVEDNVANLKLVQKIVASHKDLAFIGAASAEAGLEIAKSQRLDLILLDINLPGMDGFEALRQLRSNPLTQNIPVIAVTANAMRRDVERGLAAGFAAYLTKPLDIAAFLKTLDRCLDDSKENFA